jgi:anaerobic selenocysteine-containing dehydrogenase
MSLKQAKARGARVLVIDPFQTTAAEMADLWLRPRPGTDGAIALAMTKVSIDEGLYDRNDVANWCHGFDELAGRVSTCTPEWAERQTGVPAAQIVEAARMFARGPSSFISGHGIDATSNGVQTLRAYYCLFAISGNVDRVGGNRRPKRPKGFRTYFDILFDPHFRLAPDIEVQRIGAAQFPLWAGPLGYQMACHNPSVIEAILTGRPYPVRALYVSGVNIAVTYPDTLRTIEALKSLDLCVVASQTMTPTAAWADLILPKTTALEEEEINLNQKAPCVTYTAAASRPDGDVKSDLEIAVELIDRLAARGAADPKFLPWRTRGEFNDYLVGDSAIDIETLKTTGYVEYPYTLRNFEAQPFATPSGKIELYSQDMARNGHDPLPAYIPPAYLQADAATVADYPLVLQTGFREKTFHHSRFHEQAWTKKVSPDPVVYMHPDTAARFSVKDTDWIKVQAAGGSGSCRLKVKVTGDTLPDVLTTGVGWWRPDAPAPHFGGLDVNINAAMSYSGGWDRASGSADTRGIPCRILAV